MELLTAPEHFGDVGGFHPDAPLIFVSTFAVILE